MNLWHALEPTVVNGVFVKALETQCQILSNRNCALGALTIRPFTSPCSLVFLVSHPIRTGDWYGVACLHPSEVLVARFRMCDQECVIVREKQYAFSAWMQWARVLSVLCPCSLFLSSCLYHKATRRWTAFPTTAPLPADTAPFPFPKNTDCLSIPT